jgi:membrane protease YdiL (CAAX protease family)
MVGAATPAMAAVASTPSAAPLVAPGHDVTRPGWRPPAPPPSAVVPESEHARVPKRAALVALAGIGVGGVMQVIGYMLARDTHLSTAADIRYAMVLTMALYAVVGILIVSQLTHKVRLRWSDGQPALGVSIGLLVGGGLSVVLLALVSAAVGHLDPDPRVVLLMSEGDVPHIVATILVTCVAAPLVEEVLFRGFLLESLRIRGRGVAVWVSACAFAVWHFTPSALRYYALLGSLLGLLYYKRGLACSIAAHVGFNGVLTLAALSVVLSPGPSVNAGGLSLHLPAGWRSIETVPPAFGGITPLAAFDGPSGATLAVATLHTSIADDLQQIADRIYDNSGETSLASRSMREVKLPVGTVLEMKVEIDGHPGTIVLVPHQGGELYELELHGAGSVKADVDFHRVLHDMSLS